MLSGEICVNDPLKHVRTNREIRSRIVHAYHSIVTKSTSYCMDGHCFDYSMCTLNLLDTRRVST